MAKVPAKKLDSVLRELASSTLTETELKVFLDWFQDSPDYHASSSLTATRTGIDPSAVKRAKRSLKEKGVLVEQGKQKLPNGQLVKKHSLGKIPMREGASLSPQQDTKNSSGGDEKSIKEVTNSPPIHSNKHTKTQEDLLDSIPGAREIYERLTEPQYGNMSKKEYAIQRAYVESIPKVDLEKIREEREKMLREIDKDTLD